MNDLYRDATNEDTASAFVFDNKALQRALKHIYEKGLSTHDGDRGKPVQ